MKFSHHSIRRLSVALTMGGLAALGLLLYSPIFGQFFERPDYSADR